ncbi:MAG: hypothetical protein ACREJ5_06930 [Geminicoccaceae bacterium]
MLNLEKYFKRYIWDDERTPYLVPVARMTRSQADYELHAYAMFVGILFGMVTGGALLSQDPQIKSDAVAIYGFTVVCGAIIFAFTKAVAAAWYCAVAPLAALLYFFLHGFHPNLSAIDHAFMIVFGVIWLRYSFRVVAIARAYPDLPETGGDR